MEKRARRRGKATPRKKPAGKRKPKYSATYSTASRVVQLALSLLTTGRHLSYAAMRSMLTVRRAGKPPAPPSARTIDRYVKALQSVFAEGGFGKLETTAPFEDGRKYLFFTPSEKRGATLDESLEVMLSINLLRALEGTVLRENATKLLGKLAKQASEADRLGLQHLTKKFYVVPFGVKDYDDQRPLVDALVAALLREERVEVHYRSVHASGETRVHVFEPYTLAIYKGGLYVIGYSFRSEKRIYLAVERIERIDPVIGEDGEAETFPYPEVYTPENHTEGAFGIYDTGTTYGVELEILNAETVGYLERRRFHRTQRFEKRADGSALMTMKVRGLAEVAPWVMSMAPWVRVREPAELRERVTGYLAEGLAVYGAKR